MPQACLVVIFFLSNFCGKKEEPLWPTKIPQKSTIQYNYDELQVKDTSIISDFNHVRNDQDLQFIFSLTLSDADDEAMQRYKKSLGLGDKDISDPNDSRQCIILSLTMDSKGREPVTINLSEKGSEKTLKDKPFKIKEGTKFSMTAKFKVQHEILSGLHYVQIIKRKGVRVSKDQEMIGSYAPCTDKNPFYTKRFAEEDAPSGLLARGHYTATSTFIDDDNKVHLKFEWAFDISKDW